MSHSCTMVQPSEGQLASRLHSSSVSRTFTSYPSLISMVSHLTVSLVSEHMWPAMGKGRFGQNCQNWVRSCSYSGIILAFNVWNNFFKKVYRNFHFNITQPDFLKFKFSSKFCYKNLFRFKFPKKNSLPQENWLVPSNTRDGSTVDFP